jgi:hypothetical protein
MLRFQRNQLQTVDHDLIVDLVPVVEEVGVVVVRVVAVVVVMVAAEVTGATVVTAAGMVDAAKSGTAGYESRTGAAIKVVALLFCATITTRNTSS